MDWESCWDRRNLALVTGHEAGKGAGGRSRSTGRTTHQGGGAGALASSRGKPMSKTTTAKKKDVLNAVALNFFVPGAGYWYAGRKFLGVIVLLIAAACVAGAMAGSGPAASFA